jgi:hypothetical protein
MTAQRHENVTPLSAKPSASIVFVTPEMAARWLDTNTRNRRVRRETVNAYARDMTSGDWQLTGESVKFAPDGTLLDGQHRLHAIVKSGATVPLYVMRGITPEAQRVMDTGRKRTASDALAIRGDQHTAALAATVRLALGVMADIPDPGRYEATHAEIETFIAEYPDIRDAVEFARRIARRVDCPLAVVAYTYWVLAGIDATKAAEFWVAAADKVGLREGDPVIALTNRFAEARRAREQLTKRIYLSLIYRAWNTRRTGKQMKFIRVNSPAGGLVPVPEPR